MTKRWRESKQSKSMGAKVPNNIYDWLTDMAKNLDGTPGNSKNAILIEMLSYGYEHKRSEIEERIRSQIQAQTQKEAEAIAPAQQLQII